LNNETTFWGRRDFLKSAGSLGAGMLLLGSCSSAEHDYKAKRKGEFVLWQLPSATPSQMNSYVLQTQAGKVVVIDGGTTGDASYLKGFLAALGNRVDIWFISHPHGDHVGALTEILKKPGDLAIGDIYGSIPDEQWVEKYESGTTATVRAFNEALRESKRKVIEQNPGDILELDGITFHVLAVKNPEITANAINNSSVVMKVTDSRKTVLFTGDLGAEGGRKLMAGAYRKYLRSDYVQMAHHGQNGVDKDFYKEVRPRYCLWPTPKWLWDNDNGGGGGSGPWLTLEVRQWMKELNVEKNYVMMDGLAVIGK
jgi:hypothetical protein